MSSVLFSEKGFFSHLLSMSANAFAHSAARSCASPATVLLSRELRLELFLLSLPPPFFSRRRTTSGAGAAAAAAPRGGATASEEEEDPKARPEEVEVEELPLALTWFALLLGFCMGLHSEEVMALEEHELWWLCCCWREV